MFKKIREWFAFLYVVATSVPMPEPHKVKKITYILETTEEHLNMVEALSDEFNMTYDEYINFLIYKQHVFFIADKEAKASQIKESEAQPISERED